MFVRNLALVASAALTASAADPKTFVNKVQCAGKNYTYTELAGYGIVNSDAVDKFGDTLGGWGSSAALDRSSWKKLNNGSYTGTLFTLPDRGWNTQGTTNFQPRIHKFNILFTPNANATIANPGAQNLMFWYKDTVLLSGPDGLAATGLDGAASGHLSYPGFPDLPVTTFQGDGYGGAGPMNKRIPIDAEGLAIANDGGFYVSDEYGPYVYRFDPAGKMIGAIRPPEAFIPKRNGTDSWSANSPPYYPNQGKGDVVNPVDGPSGRRNNQGFEGLSLSGDGKTLWVTLQSAAAQEGGLIAANRRHVRMLKYDITVPDKPRYARQFVIPLPYVTSEQKKVAAQSEIFHIQDDSFFILPRDSGNGHGQSSSTSLYRHIDVFNIDLATDIKPQASIYDCANCSIASPAGVLKAGIKPAELCPFIDFNLNSQLNRFGLHNGGAQDQKLLNEKWESIVIAPVDGLVGDDDQWFVISISDNDFVTQNGYTNGGKIQYKDASGYNLDTQALVFKINLPEHSRPFPRG